MSLRVVVFYGSVRSARQGITAARYVIRRLRERGHEVTLLDAAELALPLLDKMYKEYPPGQATETLKRMADVIVPADAHVVVSGEYNHGVQPGLANMLDYFLEEFFWRPSAIVCYSAGAFGGVRGAIALRSMLAELGMSSIPSVLPIPRIQDAFDADGEPRDPAMGGRMARFLTELEWYAHAMRAARGPGDRDCPPRAHCDSIEAAAERSRSRTGR
jgi:NAD(P)H-dependent FMN reductase